LLKLENHHVFGPDLFVAAKYAYYGTGFKLDPVGGLEMPAGSSTRLGQTFGSWLGQYFLRPQHTANLDASWFRNGQGGNHEVRFGAGYRRADSSTQLVWPGQMLEALDNSLTDQRVRIFREGLAKDRAEYLSFYVGDTFSRDRLTLNLGLRYDRQWGPSPGAAAGFVDYRWRDLNGDFLAQPNRCCSTRAGSAPAAASTRSIPPASRRPTSSTRTSRPRSPPRSSPEWTAS